MEELRTYKDFADNSYQYFMFAYNSGQLFNEMGAMAQSVCEQYLKHLISEFSEPENSIENEEKERVLRGRFSDIKSRGFR